MKAAEIRIGQLTGVNPDTLRGWAKQAAIGAAKRPRVSTSEATRFKKREAENRALNRANKILLGASSLFARELDPRLP